jgi:flagellar basal body P-ring protein FlgI
MVPLVTLFLLAGADGPKKPLIKKPEPPLKTSEIVSDLARVNARAEIRVEGVGLIIGLDGTGSDAEPGPYKTKILDGMRKAGVPKAEEWVASNTTAVVLVRGVIPTGIGVTDTFDVNVELTPASTTTSLAGGILMLTELRQMGVGRKGELLDGPVLATCAGPVVIGDAEKPDDPKVGRVLGGARVKKAIPYTIVIKENRRSAKNAALIEATINRRFFPVGGSDREKMATAKTDALIELKVPATYHHNQFRYFQVVENMQLVEAPNLRAERQEFWGKELLDPKTAGASAIRLEGIGRNAIPVLKKGLEQKHPQVRFFAAESLAYLGDDSGVDVLARAVTDFPMFRAHALAALAALDQQSAYIKLQELFANPDPDIRYGAFDALRKLDPSHPFLGRVRVLDFEPEPLAEGGDAMALQIAAPPRKSRRRSDPFELYVVDCDGPPLIHVSNARRCEIVLFGRNQPLLTPVVLGTGSILINASQDDSKIHLARVGAQDHEDRQVECQPQIARMICEAANLGATYPEIVALLKSAEKQKNLPGPLRFDSIPQPGAAYADAQIDGKDITQTATKDNAVQKTASQASAPALNDSKPANSRNPFARWIQNLKTQQNAKRAAKSPTGTPGVLDFPPRTPAPEAKLPR